MRMKWWLSGGCAVLLFGWYAYQVSAFFQPSAYLEELTFQVGEPQFVATHVTSEFLWANWHEAPAEVVDASEREVFSRVLPECHITESTRAPKDESLCTSYEQDKIFWGNTDEYIWRSDYEELRLTPDSSLAEFPADIGDLLISEVSWAGSYDGSTSRTTDEWLELYNPTEKLWNLKGLKLTGVRSNGATFTLVGDFALGPYSYFLIGKVEGSSTFLRFSPDYVYSTLVLSNSRAGIQVFGTNGELLDAIPEGEWQAGVNDTTQLQRATAQRNIFAPTQDWSSWFTCSLQGVSACQTQAIGWRENTHHTLGTPWQASLF